MIVKSKQLVEDIDNSGKLLSLCPKFILIFSHGRQPFLFFPVVRLSSSFSFILASMTRIQDSEWDDLLEGVVLGDNLGTDLGAEPTGKQGGRLYTCFFFALEDDHDKTGCGDVSKNCFCVQTKVDCCYPGHVKTLKPYLRVVSQPR